MSDKSPEQDTSNGTEEAESADTSAAHVVLRDPLADATVFEVGSRKVGTVADIHRDPAGEPTMVSVNTGLFGSHPLLPLDRSTVTESGVWVPYPKSVIKSAPSMHGSTLSDDAGYALYAHYNLEYTPPAPVEEEVVLEEETTVEETPAEAAVAEETVVEEEVVTEETPAEETTADEAPADAPTAEETVVEETTVVEEAPADESTPDDEFTPAEETTPVEETADADAASADAPTDTPAAEETAVEDEVVVEETPASDETPADEEPATDDQASIEEDTPGSESTPAGKTASAAGATDASPEPDTEDAKDETPLKDEAPATNETPAEPVADGSATDEQPDSAPVEAEPETGDPEATEPGGPDAPQDHERLDVSSSGVAGASDTVGDDADAAHTPDHSDEQGITDSTTPHAEEKADRSELSDGTIDGDDTAPVERDTESAESDTDTKLSPVEKTEHPSE
ncbi:hypothetical protein MTQ12_00270 [Brevibacterium sp. R8603A2]|uniref:hypothetical protein n=1 Tax=Brevibacterium sp. R8603A2 TaxID=2929779 RepID=UPI001FF777DD|nr:hypothetical protein [Brevibacterium sp. R8603A2]MCK1801494.1 hypothetical protein [Brevibacterium sp. R8603A2]